MGETYFNSYEDLEVMFILIKLFLVFNNIS